LPVVRPPPTISLGDARGTAFVLVVCHVPSQSRPPLPPLPRPLSCFDGREMFCDRVRH
jgi:hypothetical protein